MPSVLHRLDPSTVTAAADLRCAVDAIRGSLAGPSILVVGPFAGVQDELAEVVRRARARDDTYRSLLDALGRRHRSLAEAALPAARSSPLRAQLQDDTRDLADICHALRSGGESGAARALALSCGALWSSRIVVALLDEAGLDARWRDASDVLRVGAPDARRADPAAAAVAAWRESPEGCTVVPGGRAIDAHESPIHLHPASLDRSAALLATLLSAREVTLWHRDAPAIAGLSLAEASALADADPALGAPSAWADVLAAGIPVTLRGFTSLAGTPLSAGASAARALHLRWRRDVTLIVVAGDALAEFPQGLRMLAQCLLDADAPAVLAGLGAPGEPLTVLVPRARADAAVERLRKAFLWEDRARHAQAVHRHDDVVLLRAAGPTAGPAVLAALYAAVARSRAEVLAAAQPGGGVSLSLVLRAPDLDALEASVRDAPGVAP
jgi:aspartokinase/homoserine dehydrogenase 1